MKDLEEEHTIETQIDETIKETIEKTIAETIEEQETEIITESIEIVKDETPWLFFDYSGTLVDTVNALSRTYARFLGKEFPL